MSGGLPPPCCLRGSVEEMGVEVTPGTTGPMGDLADLSRVA